jgi:hypothetical protein
MKNFIRSVALNADHSEMTEHTVISLLSPWTHNCPFSRFLRLSNDIHNTTRPCSYFVPTPGTATHDMSHRLMFGIACHNTSCVSPSCRLSARQSRIIFQATRYYIWYSRFNSRVAQTWHTLLGDILLILRTFPIACQGFTILLNLFRVSLCFLPATDRPHCPFLSCTFHYKIPCT